MHWLVTLARGTESDSNGPNSGQEGQQNQQSEVTCPFSQVEKVTHEINDHKRSFFVAFRHERLSVLLGSSISISLESELPPLAQWGTGMVFISPPL